MTKKHNFGIALLFLLFLGLVFSPPTFADGLIINNQPCTAVGGNVNYTISINNAPNSVSAFGFNISYDANILEFVKFISGDLPDFMTSAFKNKTQSAVTVGGYYIAGEGGIATGANGRIGELVFTIKSCEPATIGVSNMTDDIKTWNFQAGQLMVPVLHPPVLQSIGNKTVIIGNTLSFTAQAMDEDGDAIMYSIADSPIGAYFGTQSGEFSWTPTPDQAGTYSATITALDSTGKSDSETIQITVKFAEDYPLTETECEGVCGEDDTGQLDIEGTAGNIGSEIQIPVIIQSAHAAIHSFGFEVTYDPSVLEYKGYERGNLTTNFPVFGVSQPSSEKLRIGGMDYDFGIAQGASGYLVYLKFNVKSAVEGYCYYLALDKLADDLKGLFATGGYFYTDNTPPEIFCPTDRIIAQVDSNGTPADNPDVLAFLAEAIAMDNMDGEIAVKHNLFIHLAEGETFDLRVCGDPVPGAEVYIEQEPNDEPILFPIDSDSVFVGEKNVSFVKRGREIVPLSTGDEGLGVARSVYPSIFPAGTNEIIFTASDRAGNTSYCISTITVQRLECVEDDSGNLDIPGTTGKIEQEVWIPVQAKQITSNNLSIFSFEVDYNPSVLEYEGYERGNLVTNFPLFNVTHLGASGSGMLLVEGMSGLEYSNDLSNDLSEIYVDADIAPATFLQTTRAVSSGAINDTNIDFSTTRQETSFDTAMPTVLGIESIDPILAGDIVLLRFFVKAGMNSSCYPLKMENLANGLAGISATLGCFCVHSCNGDQNGDGEITPVDALIVFKCFLGTGPCNECCDVNQDGEITPADALCLFKWYLGQPSCLDDIIAKSAANSSKSGFAIGGFSTSRKR